MYDKYEVQLKFRRGQHYYCSIEKKHCLT